MANHQSLLKPLTDKRDEEEKQRRSEQYEELAGQMGEKFPGWEEHEDDMNELLGFLQGPSMTSRKFGSKLELLYRMAQPGVARAEAARSMADAAKSRSSTGKVTAPTLSTMHEQIRKAKTNRDAWRLAEKVAEEEARKMGLSVS